MDQTASPLRPNVIVEIAHWWLQLLATAGETGRFPEAANVSEVTAAFKCSTEEAIRGLVVGEHLYWEGSR